MAPTIGIPLCLDDRERIRQGRRYFYLDEKYPRAVERAGGTPLLLPMQRDAEALVARIDALLLPGGDDFLPDTRYPDGVDFDPAATEQIAFDRCLLAAALERALPIFGICYGAQLISLHHAGRLHHHLPHDLPDSQPHRLAERDGRHRVTAESGTRLASLLGPGEFEVNSLHHQAIAEAGSGLRVCARAPDGVVEAIESLDDSAFLLGVQWHPERLDGPAGLDLIRAFVRAAGRAEIRAAGQS
jgi:gamma-glutamyl-gamma-aminobutyrate hydrolase PuuD